MSGDINKIDIGSRISDNDPRMPNRVLRIIGFEAGRFSTHERITLAVCTNMHDRGSKPREHRINVQSIHTDGKPRKSGFSLIEGTLP